MRKGIRGQRLSKAPVHTDRGGASGNWSCDPASVIGPGIGPTGKDYKESL